MDIARYKVNNEDYETLNADNITRKQYEETYKGNLYCEYKNCNAELVFAERQKRGFSRYFSTKSYSKHRIGCPNEISHKGSKSPTIKIKGDDINLSDRHISDALTDAYKRFYDKLNPDNTQKNKRKKVKSRKLVPKTDENEATTISIVSTPTTNGEGETIIEGREPYIYKREVADIKADDKNSYREVHSLVDGMRFYEDEIYIDLKGLDGSSFSVYIGTPFKNSYEQEFKLLRNLESYINQQKQSNTPIICTSVGEIMEVDNKPIIQIYSYRHIKLDNLGLYQIINKLSK